MDNARSIIAAMFVRELRERYLSTLGGFAWVLLTPAFLLAIYAFVFVELLGARFGARVGGDVLAFLAIGLWPWHAFSDGVARATTSLGQNAALIGQIAIPRAWLVLVPSFGAIAIHTTSFVVVLMTLAAMGKLSLGDQWWLGIVAYGLLMTMASGFGLLLAPIHVFFRDVGTLLPQILTFWMLLTPIFFDRSQLRPELSSALTMNPLTGLIDTLRNALLGGHCSVDALAWPMLATVAIFGLSVLAARRFLPRIEDFL